MNPQAYKKVAMSSSSLPLIRTTERGESRSLVGLVGRNTECLPPFRNINDFQPIEDYLWDNFPRSRTDDHGRAIQPDEVRPIQRDDCVLFDFAFGIVAGTPLNVDLVDATPYRELSPGDEIYTNQLANMMPIRMSFEDFFPPRRERVRVFTRQLPLPCASCARYGTRHFCVQTRIVRQELPPPPPPAWFPRVMWNPWIQEWFPSRRGNHDWMVIEHRITLSMTRAGNVQMDDQLPWVIRGFINFTPTPWSMYIWSLSHQARNALMHAYNGNTSVRGDAPEACAQAPCDRWGEHWHPWRAPSSGAKRRVQERTANKKKQSAPAEPKWQPKGEAKTANHITGWKRCTRAMLGDAPCLREVHTHIRPFLRKRDPSSAEERAEQGARLDQVLDVVRQDELEVATVFQDLKAAEPDTNNVDQAVPERVEALDLGAQPFEPPAVAAAENALVPLFEVAEAPAQNVPEEKQEVERPLVQPPVEQLPATPPDLDHKHRPITDRKIELPEPDADPPLPTRETPGLKEVVTELIGLRKPGPRVSGTRGDPEKETKGNRQQELRLVRLPAMQIGSYKSGVEDLLISTALLQHYALTFPFPAVTESLSATLAASARKSFPMVGQDVRVATVKYYIGCLYAERCFYKDASTCAMINQSLIDRGLTAPAQSSTFVQPSSVLWQDYALGLGVTVDHAAMYRVPGCESDKDIDIGSNANWRIISARGWVSLRDVPRGEAKTGWADAPPEVGYFRTGSNPSYKFYKSVFFRIRGDADFVLLDKSGHNVSRAMSRLFKCRPRDETVNLFPSPDEQGLRENQMRLLNHVTDLNPGLLEVCSAEPIVVPRETRDEYGELTEGGVIRRLATQMLEEHKRSSRVVNWKHRFFTSFFAGALAYISLSDAHVARLLYAVFGTITKAQPRVLTSGEFAHTVAPIRETIPALFRSVPGVLHTSVSVNPSTGKAHYPLVATPTWSLRRLAAFTLFGLFGVALKWDLTSIFKPIVKSALYQRFFMGQRYHTYGEDLEVRPGEVSFKKEWAKPGKHGRLFVSYGPSILTNGWFYSVVKKSFCQPFERLGVFEDSVVRRRLRKLNPIARAIPTQSEYSLDHHPVYALDEAVAPMSNPKHGLTARTFSDDMMLVWHDAISGMTLRFDVDISGCDAGNTSAPFYLLADWAIFMGSDREKVFRTYKRLTSELTVINPSQPSEKLVIKPKTIFEGSGCPETTAVNNVAATLIVFAIYSMILRHIDKWRDAEASEAWRTQLLKAAAMYVGHQITVDFRASRQKQQFLKYSPLQATCGTWVQARNLGAILRSLGSVDGDLDPKMLGLNATEFQTMSLSEKAERFASGVVAGLKNEPDHVVIRALRARFNRPAPAIFDPHKTLKIDRSRFEIPTSELVARYGGTEDSFEELARAIRDIRFGVVMKVPIVSAIMEVDYGLPIPEAEAKPG